MTPAEGPPEHLAILLALSVLSEPARDAVLAFAAALARRGAPRDRAHVRASLDWWAAVLSDEHLDALVTAARALETLRAADTSTSRAAEGLTEPRTAVLVGVVTKIEEPAGAPVRTARLVPRMPCDGRGHGGCTLARGHEGAHVDANGGHWV